MSNRAEDRSIASNHETPSPWSLDPGTVLRHLGSGPHGLSSEDAQRGLELRGTAPARCHEFLVLLLSQLKRPIVFILLMLALNKAGHSAPYCRDGINVAIRR